MEYREDLKAFVDGELPAGKAESIRKAAESDPALQMELEELRTVAGTLQSMKLDHEVRGFEQTLMALSGHRATPPPRRRSWAGFAVGIALAGALVVVFALPQMMGRQADVSASRLVSMKSTRPAGVAAADAAGRNSTPPMAPGVAMAKMPHAGAFQAPKPAPTLQEQLKQEQAQIQDLQKQLSTLKAKPMSDQATVGGVLPAPPMLNGTIVPGAATAAPDEAQLSHSKGLPPKQIAALEARVRAAAVAAGGKVEVTGPPVLRSISVTIDTGKAATLVTKFKGMLKDAGTVSSEEIPQKADDGRTQSTQERIVELKVQREKLLQDFLPEAPQVRELDTQIKTLQESIKPNQDPPKSRIHVAIG